MGRYVTQVWPPGADGHEYAAYVPHPLHGWEPQLSRRVLDRIAAADTDLAHTARENAHKVSYRWAADSLMAQGESLSSSAIEGIYASLDGMSMGTDSTDAANRAALGNWEMVEQALLIVEDGDLLTTADILGLHSTLMERSPTPHLAGKLRQGPAWVGASAAAGMGPIGARYVPPPAPHIELLLDDLVDYINHSNHPPVLKAAIAHAQFETIHPFPDGNGRTGRALIPIALFSNSSENALHLPISRALLADRSTYYDTLLAYQRYEGPLDDRQRTAALEPWADLFADSIQRAAEHIRTAATLVADLMADWQSRLGGTRSDAAAWMIASELAFQPMFTAESLETELQGEASISAVRRGISHLQNAGIVQEIGKLGRTRLYRAAEIITLAEGILALDAVTAGGMATQAEDNAPAPRHTDQANEARRKTVQPRGSIAERSSSWRCAHTGERSKRRCIRTHGHKGQHRYD